MLFSNATSMEEIEHCPFYDLGCEEEGTLHELRQHIKKTPAKHLSYLCDGVSDLFEKYRTMQLDIEEDDRDLDLTKYRVRALDVIFSRHLIWRIDDVERRMQDAKDGIEPSIFSPPFFTGKNGYKLALSLVWRGDGEGKGRYLSVFLSILKGEHDSLLNWPFSHRVTISLLDQHHDVGARINVVRSMVPNVCKENRPFIDRPLGERNPRFGLQKFLEIRQLYNGDYIRDDTLFIKVDIDVRHITPV